jgi:hypothetical protein
MTDQTQQKPESSISLRLLLRENSSDILQPGVSSELPQAGEHDAGMMAVIDMACWGSYKDGVEDAAQRQELERDFTSLIVVDLAHGKGDLWLDGADIPDGARLAVIDAKRLALHRSEQGDGDEKVTVNNGVMFVHPGETKQIGRGHTDSGLDMTEARTVSSNHMEISIGNDGEVLVRDTNSRFQTIVQTGEYARNAVMELEDHHEHATRFRQILGAEAVENVVSDPELAPDTTAPYTESVQEHTSNDPWWLNEVPPPETDPGETPQDRARRLLETLGNMSQGPTVELTPAAASKMLDALDPASSRPETTHTPEQKSHEAACQELLHIIGENGKGGGQLGDKLRELGSSPEEIRVALDKANGNDKARNAVLGSLRIRTYSEYKNKAFLHGVEEGRMKPIGLGLGYDVDQMESLELVANIAMARLDGSFRLSDGVTVDKDELVKNGHHRDAADKVLASFAKEQVEDPREFVDLGETINTLKSEIAGTFAEVDHYTKGYNEARQGLIDYMHRDRIDTEVLGGYLQEMKRSLSSLQQKVHEFQEKVRPAMTKVAEEQSAVIRTNPGDNTALDAMRRHVDAVKTISDSVNRLLPASLQELQRNTMRYDQLVGQMESDPHWQAVLNELQRLLMRNVDSDVRRLEVIKEFTLSMR